MNYDAISLTFQFVLATVVAAVIIGLSALLGVRRKKNKAHDLPYECGVDSLPVARSRIPIKYFLIAVLFIVFDIEVVFLYPWAVSFRDFVAAGQGALMLGEMLVFLGVLFVGFIYVWQRGALDWEK